MLVAVQSWPPEAIAAFLTSLIAAIGSSTAFLLQKKTDLHRQGWQRVGELEQEIIKLRTVIDRVRTRENGYATAFELVLLAMRLPEDERAEIIARATEILEASLSGSGGGCL